MPNPDDDDLWIEIQSQVLCGLFQLSAMVKHPGRCASVYWLLFDRQRSHEEYPYLTPKERTYVVMQAQPFQ